MKYLVTINKAGAIVFSGVKIGSRDKIMDAAYDEYGACSVSVKPLLHSTEYPKTHLANPERKYTSWDRTDIRATFERVRREQERQQVKKVRRIR